MEEKFFIFKDEYGCVMLIIDEEDGVLVWFDVELVFLWVIEDWVYCEVMELSIEEFLIKWVLGMM